MHRRQQAILRKLALEEEDPVLVSEVAEELDCSEKTIRNDLTTIDAYLEEHFAIKIIKKPGVGILLDTDIKTRRHILQVVASSSSGQTQKTKLTEDELMELTYQVVTEKKAITLESLAKSFFTSKATIKNEIERINQWIKEDHQIIIKQRIGIVIDANEQEKRQLLLQLNEGLSKNNQRRNSYFLEGKFQDYEVNEVRSAFKDFVRQHHLHLTDDSMQQMVFYLLLMIKRTKQQQGVDITIDQRLYVKEKEEYQWLEAFLHKLSQRLQFPVMEDEIIFLTMQLLGSKLQYHNEKSNTTLDHLRKQDANLISTQLIKRVSELSFLPLQEDPALKDGLITHLYTMLHRLQFALPVKNPLVEDIKKMYPYMFDMVLFALKEEKFSRLEELSEDEVAFLTLHFQAAVERLQGKKKRIKKAIVVCHMGVGVSEILRAKLEAKFRDVEIVATISKRNVHQFCKEDIVDLIITTVELADIRGIEDIEKIMVSPLLDEADERKLRHLLFASPKKKASSMKKYLDDNYIFLHVRVEHPYELIEKIGDRLHIDGYVAKDFSHQALLRERASATAIGGGIAIPHGDPELVLESKIPIITLERPLQWGTEQVSVVFFLALKQERSDNRRALFHQLTRLAGDPKTVQKLAESKDKERVLALL
ncbi:BglG family transcription antiterminator [Saliterribacillus persicus]|uniref:Activator of the mannose operon (Transcriptional antiterminator) n=1 Tax=Saliterribacillus persicus TaxID=930114 RepID=A0A368XYT4_9BACI|nr:BglG family transcription antiterminator [Saliterribacillus persicus]RCW73161.1 activator of the mannose operon (transcriptional antiterminator) [Saliterribacillus persicus]